MSRWLYQLSEATWPLDNYRDSVADERKLKWPTHRVMSASSLPSAGDLIFCFYAPTGCPHPGFCGLGMIVRYLPNTREIEWHPLHPTNYLKTVPWWDERAQELAAAIRESSQRATMFPVSAAIDTDLRHGLLEWAAAKVSPRGLQPTGRRFSLPSGIKHVGKIMGAPKNGQIIGSGRGTVDVGLSLRGSSRPRRVVLPPGLTMRSKDNEVQHGILVQKVVLLIPSGAELKWRLRMYCANHARYAAGDDSEYKIGPIVSTPWFDELYRLLRNRLIPKRAASKVQDAVWEITDGEGLQPKTRAALERLEVVKG